MLIVSGAGRSYTSLTMQIMESLGLPIAGHKWVNPERHKKFNKNGIYEIPNEVIYGVKDDKYQNMVIKLVLRALYPNEENQFKGTHPVLLKKSMILVCLRKPIEVSYSGSKIAELDQITPNYFHWEWSNFLIWLSKNRWLMDYMVILDTNDYFTKPKETITQIANMLNIHDENKIKAAIGRIQPNEVPPLVWPEAHKKNGEYVDELYSYLLQGDFDSAIKVVEHRMNNLHLYVGTGNG